MRVPPNIFSIGYNYVVTGEGKRFPFLQWLIEGEAAAQWEVPNYRKSLKITDSVVTIEKEWKCQGWLLRSTIEKEWKCQGWLLRSDGGDKDSKLKDICVSFSLYKLLCLRFSGYSLPKKAHEKVWELIQHLYADGNGYERAFRVVELELSFLFDLLYTNYPIVFQSKIRVMELLLLVIDSLLFFMATSDRAKVSLLCKYVRTDSWHDNKWMEKLIGLLCQTQLLQPWERKLRHYSLLESYDYTPLRWLYNRFTATFIDQTRDGKKESKPAELSSEVKQAIFRSLMSNPWVLENGKLL
ncbi:hypothetical protein NL676_012275 [Syzygium grande]|nr:hypothetical protein NL676_012275 [Syzygium grande]